MNTSSNTNSQKNHKTMINNINEQIDNIINDKIEKHINNKPQQIITLKELLEIATKENNSILFNIVSKKIKELQQSNQENNSFQPDEIIKQIIKKTPKEDLINNQSNYYKYIVEPLSKNITNKTETGEKKGFFSKLVNKFKKTEEPANKSAPESTSTPGATPAASGSETPKLAPGSVINQENKPKEPASLSAKIINKSGNNFTTENKQEKQSVTSETTPAPNPTPTPNQNLNNQNKKTAPTPTASGSNGSTPAPNPTNNQPNKQTTNPTGGSGGKRNAKKRTTKKSVKPDKRNGRPKKH